MVEHPDDPRIPPSTTTTAPAPGATDPTVVDLDEVLRPRVSGRRRAAQAGAVLAVLPVLTVAIVLIPAAGGYYVRWGFPQAQWHGRQQAVPVWLAFNDLGTQFASKIGDSQEAVAPLGYDGQFYRKWARKPRGLSQGINGPSDVRSVLKNAIRATWTINTSSIAYTSSCTTSSGVPSGAARCSSGQYGIDYSRSSKR